MTRRRGTSRRSRRRRPTRRSRLRRLAVAAALAGAAVVLVAVGFELSLPGVGDAPARAARIVRAHGGVFARAPVPRRLGESIVAIEDEHFYTNVVLDVLDGAGRAALAALRTSGDPGGSTIVQQLAKELYGHRGGVGGTLEEIGLGVKLALRFPKPELLALYLDATYFGHGYYGDVAAARGYFGRSPAALSWAQASLLAGLPQAPSAYDPLEHFALAKARQRAVLDQLVANHDLTAAAARAAYRAPLRLR